MRKKELKKSHSYTHTRAVQLYDLRLVTRLND